MIRCCLHLCKCVIHHMKDQIVGPVGRCEMVWSSRDHICRHVSNNILRSLMPRMMPSLLAMSHRKWLDNACSHDLIILVMVFAVLTGSRLCGDVQRCVGGWRRRIAPQWGCCNASRTCHTRPPPLATLRSAGGCSLIVSLALHVFFSRRPLPLIRVGGTRCLDISERRGEYNQRLFKPSREWSAMR
jgi:hypothetical protein